MKDYDIITISSSKRTEMIDITNDINKLIKNKKIESGEIFIFIPHTTAAVTINEGADPDVQHDIITFLNRLIPKNNDFHHIEGNSDAHIKTSLIGSSEKIIINENKMLLGTWQHVFFVEWDGPRKRKIYVKINS